MAHERLPVNEAAASDPLCVRFYAVCRDEIIGGRTVPMNPQTRFFKTKEQAQAVVNEYPGAHVVEFGRLFYPNRASDLIERDQLLAELS
ncbi:hypothetical protein [Propionivibrio sp.]|uniref:hypothetical protein n=1 Tax=Propionivibrio sp. TaxID=2212460 RepID=UPI00272E23CB|nr:hypothetical protein [Propionivibrio sp.]